MANDVVIANSTMHYGESGYLREGDIWAADDPLVKAHPDWFDTDLYSRALHSTPVVIPGPAPEPSYDSNNIGELHDELQRRGLPVGGSKDELVARLTKDDKKK